MTTALSTFEAVIHYSGPMVRTPQLVVHLRETLEGASLWALEFRADNPQATRVDMTEVAA